MNGANLHPYNSTQPGNSTRGMLRLDQPLFEWLIVRVSDDAPEDGLGGASVQEVRLVVNGLPRPRPAAPGDPPPRRRPFTGGAHPLGLG